MPTPASPTMPTICPEPERTFSQASVRTAMEFLRPTKRVRPLATAASMRVSTSVAAEELVGLLGLLLALDLDLAQRMKTQRSPSPADGCGEETRMVPGEARLCMREARLVVSPMAV